MVPLTIRRPPWLLLLAVAVVVVAVYAPSLRGGFIWDDESYIRSNADLRSVAGLRRIWLEPLSSPQYYPLTFSSFWVEHQLWGTEPTGYRVVNLLLHLLNSLLVGFVLCRLDVRGAWLAAALFALHPVHVETVAWMSERKNLLSTAFGSVAVLAWLGWVGTADRRLYAAAIFVFVAALLSKTSILFVPLVLALLAWWRGDLGRRTLLGLIPFLVVAAVLAYVTAWREASGPTRALLPDAAPLMERLLVAAHALGFQIGKIIWPSGLTMIYPVSAASSPTALRAIGLASVAFGAAALAALRGARGPLVALSAYAIGLAPTLGVVDFDFQRFSFAADHFQYAPSIALLAVVAALFARACEHLAATVQSVAKGAVVIPLAVIAAQHNLDFRDATPLWEQNLRLNPRSWVAYFELGLADERRGDPAAAETKYRHAIDFRPDYALAQYNLGVLLLQASRLDEAAEHLRAALAIKSDYSSAAYNLGVIDLQRGDADAALQHFNATVAMAPRHAKAWFSSGLVWAQRGDWDKAQQSFDAFLESSPPTAAPREQLATALLRLGRQLDAVQRLREAVQLEPTNARVKGALVAQLLRVGSRREAAELCARWERPLPPACDALAGAGISHGS